MALANSDVHDMTVSQARAEAIRLAERLNLVCDRLYEKDAEYELAHDAGDLFPQETLTDFAFILGKIEQHNVNMGRHNRSAPRLSQSAQSSRMAVPA